MKFDKTPSPKSQMNNIDIALNIISNQIIIDLIAYFHCFQQMINTWAKQLKGNGQERMFIDVQNSVIIFNTNLNVPNMMEDEYESLPQRYQLYEIPRHDEQETDHDFYNELDFDMLNMDFEPESDEYTDYTEEDFVPRPEQEPIFTNLPTISSNETNDDHENSPLIQELLRQHFESIYLNE